MDFNVFRTAVAKQFDRMQKHRLFRVALDGNAAYDAYLAAFPEGTDPIYRQRTTHDCGCCKGFIRAVGNTVAVIDGKLESIWDISVPNEPAYQTVANALSTLVKSHEIANLFLHHERKVGADKTFEQMVDDIKTWDHFCVNIVPKNSENVVVKNSEIPERLAEPRTTHEVLRRSLDEISVESIDTVLELIAQKSLYRGEEHKFAVGEFLKLKREYRKLKTDQEKNIFTWTADVPGSVSRIRNTVIGTLLVDLSKGDDIEGPVKAFEAMVAPTNYKRPTAIITKGMIEKAKAKIEELGLTSALDRRHATITDITINNILFADRAARKLMTGNVFDELAAATSSKIKDFDRVEEVTIDRFIADILPRAETIEVLLENRHAGNLMSLVAPVDPTAGGLFKWDNNFSWSYAGELADSIKERVKQAGGNVSGDLCCRLAWDNHDDLDFHMTEPSGYNIHFANRSTTSPSGGRLDVDMNAGGGHTREPVENIFYGSQRTMKEGIYKLKVNNYSKRESVDVGFRVEIDFLGDVRSFAYDKSIPTGQTITVAEFRYSKDGGIVFIHSLPSSQTVRPMWGIPTQTFHKVSVMMLSPNFWDEKAVGNKHYFFILDGCKNEATTRGFFNEFLKDELTPHRKVFEAIGSRMKVPFSDDQLSGLGFSSTQKNTLVCRVKGSFTRTIKIVL